MGKWRIPYVDIMAFNPEVTGSNNLVIVKIPNGETIKFTVDCGIFQEKDYEYMNEMLPCDPSEVDFCLVTHNHIDHIGRLPYMVKHGFNGTIYTTAATKCLMLPALNNSVKVLKDTYKRQNKITIYDEEDVAKTMEKVEGCNYYETIKITENLKVTFLMNGHLIGAALILVQISYLGSEDINLLFTGDYNNKNMFFDVLPIPDWILDLPITIIQESTYGYMDSDDMEAVFAKNIMNCINNQGTVVAPVFSLGRAQEILYELKQLQEDGTLNPDIPIFFDGTLAIQYTQMYLNNRTLNINPEMKAFLPRNMQYVSANSRNEVLRGKGTKIIVTTSGMGSYGPAQTYIPEYLSREKALIHFTGYTAEGTLGHRLKSTKIGEVTEIGGLIVKKLASVEYTKEYSAHAKRDEILNFLASFKQLKLVLFNHGTKEVKKQLGEIALEKIKPKSVGILGEGYFFRIDAYGLVKTLSTQYM